MCELGDYEPWSAWSETPRKAHKQHRCSACGTTIHAGESYLVHSHVFEGSARSEKACFGCWWVREEFCRDHGWWFQPSELVYQLTECIQGERNVEWRPQLASVLRRIRVAKRQEVRP